MKSSIRTKTGCLTCRRRRKKCDETRPACQGCRRNFLCCQWPSESGSSGAPRARRSQKLPYARPRTPDIGRDPAMIVIFGDDSAPYNDESHSAGTNGSSSTHKTPQGRKVECARTTPWGSPWLSRISTTGETLGTPHALLLLQHYLEDTSTFLVAKSRSYNPYVGLIVPLAHSDDLIMNAILALSGTQLAFKTPENEDIQVVTRRHYSYTLQKLSVAVADESICTDIQATLRLILVLLVLCYVEVSGNEVI